MWKEIIRLLYLFLECRQKKTYYTYASQTKVTFRIYSIRNTRAVTLRMRGGYLHHKGPSVWKKGRTYYVLCVTHPYVKGYTCTYNNKIRKNLQRYINPLIKGILWINITDPCREGNWPIKLNLESSTGTLIPKSKAVTKKSLGDIYFINLL